MPLLTELETLYDFGCYNYAAPYDAPARRLNREPRKNKVPFASLAYFAVHSCHATGIWRLR